MNDQQLKQLWKAQPLPPSSISLDQMKRDARRLNRLVAVRNLMEYLAAAAVLVTFGFYMAKFPFPLMRLGCLLIMTATVYVIVQLRRRASGQQLPQAHVAEPWLAFRRAQLARQRDALRSVWRWYLAPFVPGIVVFRWGVEAELPTGPFTHGLLANIFIAAVFVSIAALNRYSARKFQQRLDALDRLAA